MLWIGSGRGTPVSTRKNKKDQCSQRDTKEIERTCRMWYNGCRPNPAGIGLVRIGEILESENIGNISNIGMEEVLCIMYQLAHVVNTVLYRAKQEKMPVSPMKLQKMVYFLYAEYLYRERDSLFSERFEVWKYGPVLDDVYQAFRAFGSKPVKGFMPDANGKYRLIELESDLGLYNCFESVWRRYSQMTGIELSKITHRQCGAWYSALSNKRTFLSDEDIFREAGLRGNG